MAATFHPIFWISLSILISNVPVSYAQNCNTYTFSNNNVYATCVTLPLLNSQLHWNYHPTNATVDVAFRHTEVSTSQWVAWALNLQGSGMVGAQALVALINSNGSVQAYTSSVSGYGTGMQPTRLSFDVPRISAVMVNGDVVIYATLVLGGGRTSFNQVWQVGPVSDGAPAIHQMGLDNRNSVGTVDFVSGQASADGGKVGGSRPRRRNIHGVLNAVSWGLMMPMGAMAARYLKVFKAANPAWFYIHVTCQASAYSIGVAGWVTGLKLGSDSVGIKYNTHRYIGIALFVLGTLQAFALLLRPKPENKYRFYWNIYHHSIGYTVIILSIINVFKGFDILDPEKKWKKAYIGMLIFLGVNAVILEAYTWVVVLKRKKDDKKTHVGNGYSLST
ncbi:cytochrome b561 and DOMON domain-containing protein At5g35735-like [Cynara cardunculus var. scolymus]|uniref:Cytochrome b561 and DOMON domain-containing protein n=1 Tax=Cynara cardunculus var. scolymus TaxID=59895 RepID=A0A103XLW0_CYNCS|nr:cytochrome b561 and DOMON domain-containing protein At5g35735-like [Cynara cardunculus var. scolymus]KVH93155.1 cytochrome b561, eukaryote [Cynara cardunculus var. scolymus]